MSCFVQRRDDFQIFLPRYIFVESDCAFAFDVNQHRRVVAPYRRPLVGDDQRSVVVEAFERVVAAAVNVNGTRAPLVLNIIVARAAADGDIVPALDSDVIVARARADRDVVAAVVVDGVRRSCARDDSAVRVVVNVSNKNSSSTLIKK